MDRVTITTFQKACWHHITFKVDGVNGHVASVSKDVDAISYPNESITQQPQQTQQEISSSNDPFSILVGLMPTYTSIITTGKEIEFTINPDGGVPPYTFEVFDNNSNVVQTGSIFSPDGGYMYITRESGHYFKKS